MDLSALQKARYAYKPKLPPVLEKGAGGLAVELGKPTESVADQAEVKAMFPHSYGAPLASFKPGNPARGWDRALKVGVILSGGQAPGGHNVITGLYDGLKKANPASILYGFLGGPIGIMTGKYRELDAATIDAYRNTGGFDIIGSGRDKIEKPEQFEASLKTAQAMGLDAVVIIGGDDSNTNAALLAEYFKASGSPIQVIGCPKTIDGDLKNEYIEASFGFDTACKTYAELIGNIMRDCNSAKKYWHFIKLMGRSASHIALECALQTRPNVCLVGEEVAAKKMTLAQIVDSVAATVAARAEKGLNYGVVLVPEGLIEFIPEVGALISQLSDILAADHEGSADFDKQAGLEAKLSWLCARLESANASVLRSLPAEIQAQLFLERDSHGNVQVSLIETEKLLAEMVKRALKKMAREGRYKGKFTPLTHFFGYEGRCAFPSNFDADYCYSLGYTAFALIANGLSGYLSSVRGISKPASQWSAGGIPLTMMMNMEQRHGKKKPVIRKALVELDGQPFKDFASKRDAWALDNAYLFPGPIQYWGPSEVCDAPTATLKLERG
jgi:pyrophosphate--fructose-6-phosphate 1-phosphotransferase